MRAGTSRAALAWMMVPQPPSWPVFSAASMSVTSAPRTSPTTSRSGRIRRACRTRSRSEISPLPSTFASRLSRLTTCGCFGLSSLESSTMTSRSRGSTSDSRAASSVVFPLPVPPETRNATRVWMSASSSSAPAGPSEPASTRSATERPARAGTRSDRHVPGLATGASAAWKRVPSRSRTSTNGEASSSLRPAAAANRCANRRTAASSANWTFVRCRPIPSSTYTSSGPLTRTSVIPGRRRSASSGPAPTESRRKASTTSRTAESPTRSPSQRSASATAAGVGSARCSVRRTLIRSSRPVSTAVAWLVAAIIGDRHP